MRWTCRNAGWPAKLLRVTDPRSFGCGSAAPGCIFVLFAGAEVGYIMALVSNVTSIIERLQRGESKAAEELLPLV